MTEHSAPTRGDREAAVALLQFVPDSAQIAVDFVAHHFAAHRLAVIEEAAKIADPPLAHRIGKPGLWRQRRAAIASAIRNLGSGA